MIAAKRPIMLVIAAHDPSGGAGILADIRAAARMGTVASSCITALTMQSSRRVSRVVPVPPAVLAGQIDSLVRDDGAPETIKIGALTSRGQVMVISRFLREQPQIPAVFDPVIAPSAGPSFVPVAIRAGYLRMLRKHMLPHISLITPNLPEYRLLFGRRSPEAVTQEFPCAVLVKGGHARHEPSGKTLDKLYLDGSLVLEHHRHRRQIRIHGTGCVLSSLIAASLAQGQTLVQAVRTAEKNMDDLIAHAVTVAPGVASLQL